MDYRSFGLKMETYLGNSVHERGGEEGLYTPLPPFSGGRTVSGEIFTWARGGDGWSNDFYDVVVFDFINVSFDLKDDGGGGGEFTHFRTGFFGGLVEVVSVSGV